MRKDAQADEDMQKLADLIEESPIAMLTTEEPDGSLRSRPLLTLQMDAEGRLWFFTALSSGKVGEIDQHRKVNLSYAHSERHSYVSVCGSVRLFRDRDKTRELWTPWIKPWFPDGLADPDVALLEITVHEAEYWDAPASRAGRLLGLARALTIGNTDSMGKHGKVRPPDEASSS
jgi:general stress protein 26